MNFAFAQGIADSVIAAHTWFGDLVYRFYLQYSRLILDGMHLSTDGIFQGALIATMIVATAYLFMGLVTLFKKKRPLMTMERGKEPSVTVQIPTYNELAALTCAQRCLDFDYPQEKLQIIIGDDSSDKKVSARIDAFASRHRGRLLVTRRGDNAGFKPGNLNHMLKSTKGDFIVIFDSDFLPEKDFLRKLMAPFTQDDTLSVVQARWKIVNFKQNVYSVLGGTITAMCHHLALSFIDWFKGNSFLCGSAEAIRKSDVLEMGGWQSGSMTEDIEASLRLTKVSKKLVYLEGLECGCEAPHTFRDLYRQQMRWSFGVTASLKKHLWSILKAKDINMRNKWSVLIFASGYLFSFLLLFLTVFGTLAVLSQRPAPVNWPVFLSETGFNIMLTSGILFASAVALTKSKMASMVPKMLAASLSVGLAITYYVNVGILKALFDRKMTWFMLSKNGNKVTV